MKKEIKAKYILKVIENHAVKSIILVNEPD